MKEAEVMHRFYRFIASLFLSCALLTPVLISGCAARGGRYYDRDHDDYHIWDDREDRVYRQFLAERHEEYREFRKQDRKEQSNYWKWRHDHPDSDRH